MELLSAFLSPSSEKRPLWKNFLYFLIFWETEIYTFSKGFSYISENGTLALRTKNFRNKLPSSKNCLIF